MEKRTPSEAKNPLYMLKSDIKVGMKLDLIDLRDEAYMAVVELAKESCILVKIIVGDRERPKIRQNYKNKMLIYVNEGVYSSETTILGIIEFIFQQVRKM